jgi:hypothetical protein
LPNRPSKVEKPEGWSIYFYNLMKFFFFFDSCEKWQSCWQKASEPCKGW